MTEPPSGIMPIARELGELIDAKPIDELPTIRGPMRPARARWPDEVWAEMAAIYEGRMP